MYLTPLLAFLSPFAWPLSLSPRPTSNLLLLLYHSLKHAQSRPLNPKEKKVPFKLPQVAGTWTWNCRVAWNLATSGTFSRGLYICSFHLALLLASSARAWFLHLCDPGLHMATWPHWSVSTISFWLSLQRQRFLYWIHEKRNVIAGAFLRGLTPHWIGCPALA